MQSFSFRWMKRSPHGLARSVTSPLHLSSSLLMGKEMRACFDLSRPCSFVSKFLKFILCNFEYLYVMPVWGTSLKLQRCFRDSWYKLNHAPTCTAFFFFLFIWSGMKTHCVSKFVILHLLFIYVTEATLMYFIYQHNRSFLIRKVCQKKSKKQFMGVGLGSSQQLSQTHLTVAKTESFVQHFGSNIYLHSLN